VIINTDAVQCSKINQPLFQIQSQPKDGKQCGSAGGGRRAVKEWWVCIGEPIKDGRGSWLLKYSNICVDQNMGTTWGTACPFPINLSSQGYAGNTKASTQNGQVYIQCLFPNCPSWRHSALAQRCVGQDQELMGGWVCFCSGVMMRMTNLFYFAVLSLPLSRTI
jgi:hypothetical protein